MSMHSKKIMGTIVLICGLSLIGWNLRDSEAKLREPPKEERPVALEELPAAVKATVARELAGGQLKELEEKRRGERVTWELDFVRGNDKIEVDIAEDGTVIERQSEKL